MGGALRSPPRSCKEKQMRSIADLKVQNPKPRRIVTCLKTVPIACVKIQLRKEPDLFQKSRFCGGQKELVKHIRSDHSWLHSHLTIILYDHCFFFRNRPLEESLHQKCSTLRGEVDSSIPRVFGGF